MNKLEEKLKATLVPANHPLAELLAKKLMGIEIVPRAEQTRMVRRAIKAAVLWAEANIDK